MRKKVVLIVSGVIFIALLIAALSHIISDRSGRDEHIAGDHKIVVASPHPIEFMKPLLNEFETQTGIRTEVFQCGTSEAVERIQEGESIDILWGGSILSVGSYDELFSPYRTSNYDSIRSEFKDVPETITCFTDVPSILLVNTDLIGDIRIEGQKYICYETALEKGLKIFTFSDVNRSLTMILILVTIIAIIFIAIIFIALRSTATSSEVYTRDVKKIENAFEEVKQGNLDVSLNIDSSREFQTIGEDFNEMLVWLDLREWRTV